MARRLAIAIAALTLVVVGVGSVFVAIDRVAESRSGPVHRFPIPPDRSFLTEEDAARLAREVMNRDGFPEPAWRIEVDNRPESPNDRRDYSFSVAFWCDDSPTPRRYVNIEVQNDEVVARGVFGK